MIIYFEKGELLEHPSINSEPGYYTAPTDIENIWINIEIPAPGESNYFYINSPASRWDPGASDYKFYFDSYKKLIDFSSINFWDENTEAYEEGSKVTEEIKKQILSWLKKFWEKGEGFQIILRYEE